MFPAPPPSYDEGAGTDDHDHVIIECRRSLAWYRGVRGEIKTKYRARPPIGLITPRGFRTPTNLLRSARDPAETSGRKTGGIQYAARSTAVRLESARSIAHRTIRRTTRPVLELQHVKTKT